MLEAHCSNSADTDTPRFFASRFACNTASRSTSSVSLTFIANKVRKRLISVKQRPSIIEHLPAAPHPFMDSGPFLSGFFQVKELVVGKPAVALHTLKC